MQVLIDISNWLYNAIMEHKEPIYSQSLGDAVRDGVPLPKGHGKLVDADELLTSEKPRGIADDVWKESHIYKLLSNAQPIIEADTEDKEQEEMEEEIWK